MAGLIRLAHPFPSLLDGLIVGAVALTAGAGLGHALHLGVSMTALQASIGALNDVHDAPVDAGRKPGKPIPAGLVGRPLAAAIAVAAAGLGIALGAIVDIRVGLLAVVVLSIGYGYDLLAKGTPWSWLPFAVGIPILPVYGWLGASPTLPPFFAALLPMAVLAGAALAIANARADLERDLAAGTASIATTFGLESAWRVHAGLWSVAFLVGLTWLAFRGVGLIGALPVVAAVGLIGATVGWSRERPAAARERAWELEAVGAGLALVAWLAVVVPRP